MVVAYFTSGIQILQFIYCICIWKLMLVPVPDPVLHLHFNLSRLCILYLYEITFILEPYPNMHNVRYRFISASFLLIKMHGIL
jgi:hypothetical protein